MTPTPLDRLKRLVDNAHKTSPHVTHPDQIKGCMFRADRPYISSKWGEEKPRLITGISYLPIGLTNFVVEWNGLTGEYLAEFERVYDTTNWTIDFCRDAWQAWQDGLWEDA